MLPALSTAEAKEKFPKGVEVLKVPSEREYMRFVRRPHPTRTLVADATAAGRAKIHVYAPTVRVFAFHRRQTRDDRAKTSAKLQFAICDCDSTSSARTYPLANEPPGVSFPCLRTER